MDSTAVSWELKWLLGGTIVLYVIVIYGMSIWVRGRIRTAEDYVVAGRRLPLSLAWATILATWFGACTMLTVTDEVAKEGLHRAAMDPFGASVCLLLAGFFFARPLWRMKLLTVSDFFARRFGRVPEIVSALIMTPSYFGWIAAQFVGVAGMLHLFFGLPMVWGICLTAAVGTGYTLLGGMWSVTITDALQIALVIGGLLILTGQALCQLGQGSWSAGMFHLWDQLPVEARLPIDISSLHAFYLWLNAFFIGALGNIPGQDLMQRIFSSKSERVAQQACILAGLLYLILGMLPILLGLVAKLVFPEDFKRAVLPALAHLFLHPVFAVIFVVALLSAVLSTIDSAILSPATVLAENIVLRVRPRWSGLWVNHCTVLLVGAASLATALAGETMYQLLEDAYEITFVGLFIPLCLGLWSRRGGPIAATVAMLLGSVLWLVHYAMDWQVFFQPWAQGYLPDWLQLPSTIPVILASLTAYYLFSSLEPRVSFVLSGFASSGPSEPSVVDSACQNGHKLLPAQSIE
ncbi:MAG: sodium:solute symporter family protein [Thermoguttaceae bacterium]|nr:sodium:solute symporter family protein [Thermoguttaceae bacterium]MDW8038086.1 sodium:solute symporter family protein [Thermoguttaceae bacterium]